MSVSTPPFSFLFINVQLYYFDLLKIFNLFLIGAESPQTGQKVDDLSHYCSVLSIIVQDNCPQ